MDEDWRNAFGISLCTEMKICDAAGAGAGAGICDGAQSTCSSCSYFEYIVSTICLKVNLVRLSLSCFDSSMRTYVRKYIFSRCYYNWYISFGS